MIMFALENSFLQSWSRHETTWLAFKNDQSAWTYLNMFELWTTLHALVQGSIASGPPRRSSSRKRSCLGVLQVRPPTRTSDFLHIGSNSILHHSSLFASFCPSKFLCQNKDVIRFKTSLPIRGGYQFEGKAVDGRWYFSYFNWKKKTSFWILNILKPCPYATHKQFDSQATWESGLVQVGCQGIDIAA